MKRFVRAWAVAALAVGMGTGCADEQEALIVLHSVAGEFIDPQSCSFDPASGPELVRGNLDVLGGTAYTLAPVLLNNLASNSSNSNVGTSEVQLKDVDISVHLPTELAEAVDREIPRSYTLAIATDSLVAGEMYAAVVDAVQPELTQAIAEVMVPGDQFEISVDIVYHATRSGNSRGEVGVIDSRLYTFPIHLCAGCMMYDCSTCPGAVCPAGLDPFARLCGNAQDRGFPGVPEECIVVDDTSDPAPAGSTGDPMTDPSSSGGDASSSSG